MNSPWNNGRHYCQLDLASTTYPPNSMFEFSALQQMQMWGIQHS